MNITDFFALVLPASGHIVIAEQLEKGYRHFTTEALDTAVQKAVDLNFDHKNVFFALAGFKAEKVWNPTAKAYDGSLGRWQTRTQANAGWLRCLFLDLDIDLLGLGQHRNGRGGGVDTPAAFGRGHALDAVNAAFELQPTKHAVAGDRGDDFLVAADLALGD